MSRSREASKAHSPENDRGEGRGDALLVTPATEGDAAEQSGPADRGRGVWQAASQLALSAVSNSPVLVRDPRLVGVLHAVPRVGSFLYRDGVRRTGIGQDDDIAQVRPSPGLVLQALVDEVLIALFHHPDLMPAPEDYSSAAAELTSARALFDVRGWLDHPEEYHHCPEPPRDLSSWRGSNLGLTYQHIAFASDWEPDSEEPGRDRWLKHEANRTMHAWVSGAGGDRSSSWLVCCHGFGMGNRPYMDLQAFRAPRLHRGGVNLVVPVLPLHGPRASGRIRGEDLMTIDLVDSMHGVAQAVWDVRRVIRWLRATQGAGRIGVMGYSFGALVAAVVAALEDDLACVIAGIPVVSLPELFRRHSGPHVTRLADAYGVLGEAADDVHRVVSPLAMECKVPQERRYVFAGLADRMSTFEQARRLWLHWDRPELAAYQGGHVGFFCSGAVRDFVDRAVVSSFDGGTTAPAT